MFPTVPSERPPLLAHRRHGFVISPVPAQVYHKAAARPIDRTADVRAASHVQRPVFGGTMLTHGAQPNPPPPAKVNDLSEAAAVSASLAAATKTRSPVPA